MGALILRNMRRASPPPVLGKGPLDCQWPTEHEDFTFPPGEWLIVVPSFQGGWGGERRNRGKGKGGDRKKGTEKTAKRRAKRRTQCPLSYPPSAPQHALPGSCLGPGGLSIQGVLAGRSDPYVYSVSTLASAYKRMLGLHLPISTKYSVTR